jgi:hypothetical protein
MNDVETRASILSVERPKTRSYNNLSNNETQDIASLQPSFPMPITPETTNVLRPHAEDVYAEELAALRAADPTGTSRPGPPSCICWAGNWTMALKSSPNTSGSGG